MWLKCTVNCTDWKWMAKFAKLANVQIGYAYQIFNSGNSRQQDTCDQTW